MLLSAHLKQPTIREAVWRQWFGVCAPSAAWHCESSEPCASQEDFDEEDGEVESLFRVGPTTRRGIVHKFVTLIVRTVLVGSANVSTGANHVIYGTALIWLGGLNLGSQAWVSVSCGAIAVGLVNVAMRYDGLDRHLRGLAMSGEALRMDLLSHSAGMFGVQEFDLKLVEAFF